MRIFTSAAALAALLTCVTCGAIAQPGPTAAAPSAMPAPAGPRSGPHMANRPRVGRDYTPGWSMMSAQERDDFHQRLAGAKTRAECRQLMDEHRQAMAERAKERGVAMRRPRHDACAALRR